MLRLVCWARALIREVWPSKEVGEKGDTTTEQGSRTEEGGEKKKLSVCKGLRNDGLEGGAHMNKVCRRREMVEATAGSTKVSRINQITSCSIEHHDERQVRRAP